MRKLGIAVALILCLGLLGVPQASVTIPCTRVDPTAAGSFLVWVQNNTTKNIVEFRIVFAADVRVNHALGVNGTNRRVITGEGGVWTVILEGAGLKPGGFLLVSVTALEPVTVTKCADLVRVVFPL
jgi:hypothetical protein